MPPPQTVPPRTRRLHVNPRLTAVAVLAAALVALGAWVLVDRYAGTKSDAAALIDGMSSAISAGDEKALASFFTKDAVLTPDDGSAPVVGAEAIGRLASMAETNGFRVERVAPVVVEGDFASTFMRYTSGTGSSTMVAVFQLGSDRIVRQWIFSLGRTPPFDNAVVDRSASATTPGTSSSHGLASPEVVKMLRDRIVALNSGDSAAVSAFYSRDAVLEERDVTPAAVTKGSGQIGGRIGTIVRVFGMQLESASPVIRLGDTVAEATSVPGHPDEGFILVYALDANGKIAHQWVLPAA